MRGAWGKPYGTVARVNIGQIILSVRTKDANAHVVMEALRRARYKFPGRQKIIVSKKWGFTNVNKQDYMKLKEEKKVLQCVSIFLVRTSMCMLTLCARYQGRSLRTVYQAEGPSRAEPTQSAEGLIVVVVCIDISISRSMVLL